jgi:hypothetical protein
MSIGCPANVSLELREKAGYQVDRATKLRNFLKVERHPQVVLGGMKPDPGHGVLACHVVRIIRLMLVPHEGQGYRWHCSSLGLEAVVVPVAGTDPYSEYARNIERTT